MQTFISFCQGKGEKGLQEHFIFVQKLRKFVQKILKRPDVFQQPFPFLSYSNAESSFSKRKAHRKLP